METQSHFLLAGNVSAYVGMKMMDVEEKGLNLRVVCFRSVEHCFHMCDRVVIYFFIAASYTPWWVSDREHDILPWPESYTEI